MRQNITIRFALIYVLILSFICSIALAQGTGTEELAPNLMFGNNLQHTRQSPFVGSSTNDLKCSLKIDQTSDSVGFLSSPAIGSNGMIYVGSNDHNLYAINPDGTKKWSYKTGGLIVTASPAIGNDGTSYIGSDDGSLYAIGPGNIK